MSKDRAGQLQISGKPAKLTGYSQKQKAYKLSEPSGKMAVLFWAVKSDDAKQFSSDYNGSEKSKDIRDPDEDDIDVDTLCNNKKSDHSDQPSHATEEDGVVRTFFSSDE